MGRRFPGRRPLSDSVCQGGFTYLGILVAIVILSAVLGATAEVWHTASTREKERELLFVGHQFRQAIELYYRNTPGAVKNFPPSLEALLKDPRFPGTQRYLRRIYRDPITGVAEWGLVKGQGGVIVGVYSLSEAHPIKTKGFGPDDRVFEEAERYADWVFISRRAAMGPGSTTALGGSPELDPPAKGGDHE